MPIFKALEKYIDNYRATVTVDMTYRDEVGKSGDRRLAFEGMQDQLVDAFKRAREFQLANRTPQSANVPAGPGRVKALADWHTAQMDGNKGAGQRKLNDDVIFLRKWLSRQGAWFSADGQLLWPKTMELRVVYDSELERQNATKITISGGMLYRSNNELFDTARYVTHFSGPGKAIYVMSSSGNLHVHSHSVGHYHHSSLLAGVPVACAGELEVRKGRITWLSNKSGHYMPSRVNLLEVLAMLQNKGVPLTFPLTVLGTRISAYINVEQFMIDQMLDDESLKKVTTLTKEVAAPEVTTSNGYKRPGGYEVDTVQELEDNAPHHYYRAGDGYKRI